MAVNNGQHAAETVRSFSTPGREQCELTDIDDRDWQLELAQGLQRSLHVDEMLTYFVDHVGTALLFDSLGFTNPQGEPLYESDSARTYRHRCELQLNEHFIGAITFSRTHAFEAAERDNFDKVVSYLVYPLRNA